MELGIGTWAMQAVRMAPRHHATLYREMVGDCQLAEDLGFHSFWLAEHHFWYDAFCPSLLVAIGALGAATSRIKLCTGMLLAPQHDPLRVAEQAAVADIISHGRLVLGLANGYRDVEFDGFGLRRRDRGARLTEEFEILTRAWSSEKFSFEGKQFSIPEVRMSPWPLQRPYPPIPVGTSPALAAKPLERAGKFAFGLLLPPVGQPTQYRQAIKIWEKAASQAGHDVEMLKRQDPARIGVMYDVWVDETTAAAKRVIPKLRSMYKEQLGGWRFLVDENGRPVGFDRPDILNGAVEAAVGLAIIGNPAKVIRELKRLQEVGVGLVCARIRWDSLSRKDLHRCMKLLANEVMPALA